MKATLRIPTQDQYAFIEIETEVATVGEAIEAYHTAIGQVKPQEGIPTKDYNAFLDKYLETNTGDVDIYQKMSPLQQGTIQEIKRSLKRIDYKNKK